MTYSASKNLAAAALIPLSIASALALFIAPISVIIWLLFNGAWSAAGWCALSAIFAAFLAFVTLMFGGFLGPFGMMFLPVLAAAYAQYDFLNFSRGSLPAEHQVAFVIFSLLIGVLPVMNLGRGEERAPSVISMHGIFVLLVGGAAWLYHNGVIQSYWHFALIYLAGSIIGFFIAATIAKSTES